MLVRAGVTTPVDAVVRRTGGQRGGVYEARLRADDPVILKVYEPRWAWRQAKETHVYGLLAAHAPELAGRVPRVLGAEDADNPTGCGYTVLTRIPGKPLCEEAVEPAPDARYAVYEQIGALLRAVHRVPLGGFGYLVTEILDPATSNQASMQRQFDKKLREFAALGGRPELARAIERVVAAHEGMLAVPVEPVLCHNDLHEGNVLVGPDLTVHGFVDVENAVAADPMIDLAKTEYYSIRDDEAKRAGLLAGYGRLPADVEDRLALYRLYHALELWDWFAQIGERVHLAGIAADIEAMTDS